MSDNKLHFAIGCVIGLLALGVLGGAVRCNAEKNETRRVCLEAGHDPVECALLGRHE